MLITLLEKLHKLILQPMTKIVNADIKLTAETVNIYTDYIPIGRVNSDDSISIPINELVELIGDRSYIVEGNTKAKVYEGTAGYFNLNIDTSDRFRIYKDHMRPINSGVFDIGSSAFKFKDLHIAGGIKLGINNPFDMYYNDDYGNLNRIPIGEEDEVLSIVSGVPTWKESNYIGTFNALLDTQPYTLADIGKFVKVNDSGTGLDYSTIPIPNLSGYVTIDTLQTITGLKYFKNNNGIQIGHPTVNQPFILLPSSTVGSLSTTLQASYTTAHRVISLPDKDGTLALTTDIPTVDLTNYARKDLSNTFTENNGFIGNSGITILGKVGGVFKGNMINLRSNLGWDYNNYDGVLTTNLLTANRTWNLPNDSGTIALTSDVSAVYNSILWQNVTNQYGSYIKPKDSYKSVLIGVDVGYPTTIYGGFAVRPPVGDSNTPFIRFEDSGGNTVMRIINQQTYIFNLESIVVALLGSNSNSRINLKAPFNTFTAYTLTFPSTGGTSGQVLTTNGSGTLSWTTVSGGGTIDVFEVDTDGLVPGPTSAANNIFLASNGTWQTVDAGITTSIKVTDGTFRTGEVILNPGNAITIIESPTKTFTFNHADTSSQANTNNSGVDFIKNITLDTYGHIQTITSATIPSFTGSAAGLVPVVTSQVNKFLRDDGSWQFAGSTVTLNAASIEYITLTGSDLRSYPINLSTHVTGSLPLTSLSGYPNTTGKYLSGLGWADMPSNSSHDAVTLHGSSIGYITLTNQQIRSYLINLSSHVTGSLALSSLAGYPNDAGYYLSGSGWVLGGSSYTHPTGFTNQPNSALTGASVISQIIINDNGHVTGVSTRNLTAANIGAEPTITVGSDNKYWFRDKTWQFVDYSHISNRPTNFVTTDTTQDITAVKTFTAKIKAIGLDIYKSSDITKIVTLSAAPTLANSLTFYLPITDGTANQAMITDGNGYFGWKTFPTTMTGLSAGNNKIFYSNSSGVINEITIPTGIAPNLYFLMAPPVGTIIPHFRDAQNLFIEDSLSPGVTLSWSYNGGLQDWQLIMRHRPESGYKHIPSGGSTGNILVWSADGTATWGVGGGGGATALSQLSDVSLGTLVTGNVLQWNGANWTNATVSGTSHDRLHAMTNSLDHSMNTARMIGRTSSGSGAPEELTAANVLTFIGVTENDWKNVNITQAQIEAKLVGQIITHTHDYDKYTSWSLAVTGVAGTSTISSGNTVTFQAGANVSLTRSGSTIIINATSDSSGSTWLRANAGTLLSGNLTLLNGALVNIIQSDINKSFTFNHSTVAVPSNATNTGNTVIQSLTFDNYGHITAIGTTTLSPGMVYPTTSGIVTYTDSAWGTSISNGTGLLRNNGSGTWTYDNNTYLTSIISHSIGLHTANPWRIFYSNGSGVVTELGFGVAGTVLTSNGTAAIPIWNVGGNGTHSIVDSNVHTDVQITNLQVGEILKWNGSKWTNQPDATGGGTGGDGYIDGSSFNITTGLLSLFEGSTLKTSTLLDGRYLLSSDFFFIDSISVTGTTTKTIKLTYNDNTFIEASFTDNNDNNYVSSISGSGNSFIYLNRLGLSQLSLDLTHTHSEYLPINTQYVSSFNTRFGAVSLLKADVEAVLQGLIITHTHNYTNNAGTVTSVTAGSGLSQSGTSTINPTLYIQSVLGTAGSVGTIVVDGGALGISLGNTSITAAPGDHTHSDLHTKKHIITSGDDHEVANAWKVFYTSTSKSLQELSLGASDSILTSTSTSTVPIFKDFYSFDRFSYIKKGLVPAPTDLGSEILESRFLRADGEWIAPSGTGGGMSNPMDSLNDIIIGGIGGAPARLGKGANGTVLTINTSGNIQWIAPEAVGHGNHTGDVTSSGLSTTLTASAITSKLDSSATTFADTDIFLVSKDVAGVNTLKGFVGSKLKAYIFNYNTSSTPKLLLSQSGYTLWLDYKFTTIPQGPGVIGTNGQRLKWDAANSKLVFYTPQSLTAGDDITVFSYNGDFGATVGVTPNTFSRIGHTHAHTNITCTTTFAILGTNGSNAITALTYGSNTNLDTNALSVTSNGVLTAKLETESLPKLGVDLNANNKNINNINNIVPRLISGEPVSSVGSSSNRFRNIYGQVIDLKSTAGLTAFIQISNVGDSHVWKFIMNDAGALTLIHNGTTRYTFGIDGNLLFNMTP